MDEIKDKVVGFRIRVSSFGFRDDFVFQDSGFGIRVLGFGFRA